MITNLWQIIVAPSVGTMIIGAFATGIITLMAFELSKREWITLTAALASSVACVFLGYLPAWVAAIVVIVALIWLAYDHERGKW